MAKSGRSLRESLYSRMLRTCLSQVSRPSSSCARSNLLHTSSTLHAELARRSSSYGAKKTNTLIKNEKRRNALEMRPHIVLGHRPGDEAKWQNCDLAKILVSDEELQIPLVDVDSSQPPFDTTTTTTTTELPTHLNFGIGKTDKELLFRDLPELSAQAVVLSYQQASPDALAALHDDRQEHEKLKLSQFAKIVDLKNADAQGIAYENKRRIVLAFSGQENSYDTGSTEVQVALLTYRIRNLYLHLTKFRRDVGNRRGLRTLVHRRAKLLKYLKQKHRQRYDVLLERLGLEPASVEGELVL